MGFVSHCLLKYAQKLLTMGKLSIRAFNCRRAQGPISSPWGHFVSYIIRPNLFSTPIRIAWSLILATACFNHTRRTCHKHKNTLIPGHTNCNPPISACAQSVMKAFGIQPSCADANFMASALIHGSRSGCLELEVIMYATGTPFSQSSKTIKVYSGNCNHKEKRKH